MRHLFLSYSRKDAAIMQRLRGSLIAEGLPVWTDEDLKPGTPSWKSTIEAAIEEAGGMVVILSPDAKQSEWVERELDYAKTCGVQIFPVLARGDERSAVPFELINAQWVDMRADDIPITQKLIPALYAHLGVERGEQQTPPPAVETPPQNGLPTAPVELPPSPAPPADHKAGKQRTPAASGKRQRSPRQQTQAKPAVDDQSITRELGSIWGFTREELVLNRAGRVSTKQRFHLFLNGLWLLGFGLLAIAGAFIMTYFVLFGSNDSLSINHLWQRIILILFAIFMDLFLLLFGVAASSIAYKSLSPKIETAIGPLTYSGTNKSPYLVVGDKALSVSAKRWNKMRASYPGQFCMYYIPENHLLSIEPWNEPES
jgi:hypothetical protein